MAEWQADDANPFGEADCESEIRHDGRAYEDIFFTETPFNAPALDPRCYLIIGRRGAGKTALCQFFQFQKIIRKSQAIVVRQEELFEQVLERIGGLAIEHRDTASAHIAKIWNYVLWSLLARAADMNHDFFSDAMLAAKDQESVGNKVKHLLRTLLKKLLKDEDGKLIIDIERLAESKPVQKAKEAVLKQAAITPIILGIDTAEQYDVENWEKMASVAGLVQCVADFNSNYSRCGIHIKLLLPAESYPHLEERYVANPLKHLKNPVHLNWRPRDLLRLICWRFHHYLAARDGLLDESKGEINWDKFESVRSKMWDPYFGTSVRGRTSLDEPSFVYVLRHTQMRPRQMILLCNHIAKLAREDRTFPRFSPDLIRQGVREQEISLANEVINAYSFVYPNANTIVDGLMGAKPVFAGKYLDKVASRTASQWEGKSYSQLAFRELVAQLGIIGRVRQRNDNAGWVEADFAYAVRGRLSLVETDECVIHPMFCAKFNIQMDKPLRVLPFPDHPEFHVVRH